MSEQQQLLLYQSAAASNRPRRGARAIGMTLRTAWRLGLRELWRRKGSPRLDDSELWELDVKSRRLSLWAAANLKRRAAIMRCTGRPASSLLFCSVAARAEAADSGARALSNARQQRQQQQRGGLFGLRAVFAFTTAAPQKPALSKHRQNHPSYAAARAVRCLLEDWRRYDASARSDDATNRDGKAITNGGVSDSEDSEDDDDEDENEDKNEDDDDDEDDDDADSGNGGGEDETSLAMDYGGWISDLGGWLTHREDRRVRDLQAEEAAWLLGKLPSFNLHG